MVAHNPQDRICSSKNKGIVSMNLKNVEQSNEHASGLLQATKWVKGRMTLLVILASGWRRSTEQTMLRSRKTADTSLPALG